jgi:N-acetyl-anhydromuramyl-L-alanine amidase AmpD
MRVPISILTTLRDRWKLIAAVVALIAASFGIGIAVDDIDGDGRPDRITIERKSKTVDPPGPVGPVKLDTGNEVQRDEMREHEKESEALLPDDPDLHEDMRDETPPGVSQAEVNEGREQTEALADKLLGEPRPPAGAQAYSCPRNLVRNRSSLAGPRVGTALHFTVSSPGSMNAIIGLFNTPSFGASSNYIIELDGRCRQLVPNGEKAWAQGAANSAYFSIEIVTNDLSRSQWLAAPIIRRGILAALVRDLNRSVGAPLKLVDPVGCAWTPGITDHDRLECGNTHWDVGGNFPWDVFVRQVRNGVKVAITSRHRSTCRKVHAFRAGKRHDPKRQAKRLAYVRRGGLKCVKGKPVRR